MTTYPESGIKLVADTKEYTSAMDDAIFLADYFDSLGELTLNVSADVDTSALDDITDLPLDGETINFTVDATVEGDLADLPLDGETVNYTVEADVEGELTDLPVDGETIDTTVDVQETDTAKETLSAIQTIKNLKVIETVWNIAGTAVDLFKDLGGKAITPMLQLGDAVAEVGAKTGGAIPNADKLINGIFYDDLGKSKEEVGKLIVTAHGLGLPVEEATRAALTFTHTWSDTESTTAITTFGTMLKTNLVDNMQEASDLMSVFFQQGGNKGGDALQVVNANAESWSNMGLTASEALSTISTLLQGNVDNATDAAKMIQTMDDNLTAAAADANSPQAKMLGKMGLENPKDSGKAMGADFIDGFAAAFANLAPDQQDLASGLFMGKGGKKFTGAIEGMSADSDMFKNAKDAAKIAAQEIDDSLTGAIDDFVLAANQKMEEFLSSDAIDLDGKINALKTGLQDGLNVLAEGGSLSEGLTVALKPIGFDDEFQGLESALGNLVIGILQAVAMLQENPLIGNNAEAAAGTRATLAGMAQTQLAFDLKIANPDDVATEISTAVSRGVAPQTIADTVAGVVNDLISQGAVKQAQELVDTLSKPIDMNKVPLLANGTPMNVEPQMTPEALAKLQAQIDTANANAADTFLVQQQNAVIDATNTVKPGVDGLKSSATQTVGPVQQTAIQIKTVGVNAGTAGQKTQSMASALDEVTGAAPPATASLLDTVNALDAIVNKATAVGKAADVLATKNTDTAPSSSTGGSSAPPDERGLVGNGITSALLNYVPSGSTTSGSGGNFTAINNNLIQSQAQADALGYSTAEQLRGMAQVTK